MKLIGVIAEDKSDVDVVDEIIRKYNVKKFRLIDFVGNGCGRIPAKCRRWSENLRERGCTSLILLHDADNKDVKKLMSDLQGALRPYVINPNIIVIPVQEIEAWLLSDETAIRRAMKLRLPVKRYSNPETLNDPKANLAREIYQKSEKKVTYLNTKHNRLIARESALGKLRRCSSFRGLDEFITQHLV